MGGTLEGIGEVADSSVKTPSTWPPWGQSGCFYGDWVPVREPGGNCLAAEFTHSELTSAAFFWPNLSYWPVNIQGR